MPRRVSEPYAAVLILLLGGFFEVADLVFVGECVHLAAENEVLGLAGCVVIVWTA